MQDIIFSGSEKRKSLPYSEVNLTFSDCEAELGSSFHEVEVSRRVSRDGSSQYRINGKVSRLKDIQRLFMDTGVGQIAYSFLVQGQVDQILSTNPADRRTIFEEAAGITRYKSQRKETLNKLALVDANLSRVSDVIDEVSRQIGSLKRQAAKAIRFKKLSHRQNNLELALHSFRIRELDRSIVDIETEVSDSRAQANAIRNEIESVEESISSEKNRRSEIYGKIEETQENIFDLRSVIESSTSQVEMLVHRNREDAEKISSLQAEVQQLISQKDLLKAQSAEETETKQQQLDLLGVSDNQAAQKEKGFEEASQLLVEAESELRSKREQILTLENSIVQLRSKCTTLEVDLKSFEVRHASHGETVHSAKEESERLNHLQKKTQQALDQREKDSALAEEALENEKREISEARERFKQAQTEVQDLDRQLARASARKQILRDLQDRMEGFGEGAKSILQGDLGEGFDHSDASLLSTVITVDPDFTSPAEALLGNSVDGVIWKNADELPRLLGVLREKNIARTTILSAGSVSPNSISHPDLMPALSKIHPKDESLLPLFETLLGDCYFASSEESLLRWISENPNLSFGRMVTPEGTVFCSNGTIIAGKPIEEDKSLLGREAEIQRLNDQISQLEKSLDSKREKTRTDQELMDRLESSIEIARDRRNEINAEKSALEAETKAISASIESNLQILAEAEERMGQLENSREESQSDLDAALEGLTEVETKLNREKESIVESESLIEGLRTNRDQKREEWTKTRLDHASQRQALELVEKGISETARRSEELELLNQRRLEEISQLSTRTDKTVLEIKEQEIAKERAASALSDLKVDLEEARSSLKDLDQFLGQKEKSISEQRRSLQDFEQSANRKEMELTKQRSQVDFILEISGSRNDIDVRACDWRKALWDADRDFKSSVKLDDLEEGDDIDLNPIDGRGEPAEDDLERYLTTDWTLVEEESKRLREKINSMGAVNLVAIEEYKDLKERFEFLRAQSQDLWNSKEELLRAIDEINETSQHLFQQTFEKIRENFTYTYDHLTNGGKADLSLIEAEDILDSGIEIRAQPPGVRTATLSLLSGGQRTMAAVALLFAIYMVKPSPFCVLDELDAPLDDANIGRFTEMLKKFTEFSQFLIITHNKRTIAASDSVFGVTMQEKGVSKMVSMRFNHNTQKAEFAEGELAGEAIATQ